MEKYSNKFVYLITATEIKRENFYFGISKDHEKVKTVSPQNQIRDSLCSEISIFLSSLLSQSIDVANGYFYLCHIQESLYFSQLGLVDHRELLRIRYCCFDPIFYLDFFPYQIDCSRECMQRTIHEIRMRKEKLRFKNRLTLFPHDRAQTGDVLMFENGTAGILVHEIFGHLLEADYALSRGEEWVNQVINKQRITPLQLTVIDDPSENHLTTGIGNLDDEGEVPTPVVLVNNGCLNGLLETQKYKVTNEKLCGVARSQFLGECLPRMRRTIVLPAENCPGASEVSDVIMRIDELVQGSIIPNTKGDFTVICKDVIVETPKIKYRLPSLCLKGAASNLFKSISCINNDFTELPYSCVKQGQEVYVTVGAPTISIKWEENGNI